MLFSSPKSLFSEASIVRQPDRSLIQSYSLGSSKMFTIKAGYSDNFEVETNVEKVREFFADIRNFADLMPGIASIHTDAKGVAHWKIEANIPLVGQIMQ